jgi:myo-inositol-1(or 4)-monophosphatase
MRQDAAVKELRPETVVAIDAAQRALVLAEGGTGDIHFKVERDVVTDTDVAIEDLIRATVDADLGLPVVGEERGGQTTPGESYWLVDPICGTRNFASGIREFSVNMAFVERGEIVIAVVGNGSTGDVHLSERGEGAWTLRHEGPRQLQAGADSRVVNFGSVADLSGPERERAARVAAASIRADRWDLRSFGTTLTLAYLAEGRIAASIHFSSPALHCGAGTLLASESGAIVTDFDGVPWTIDSGTLLASASNELHVELLELLHFPEART